MQVVNADQRYVDSNRRFVHVHHGRILIDGSCLASAGQGRVLVPVDVCADVNLKIEKYFENLSLLGKLIGRSLELVN